MKLMRILIYEGTEKWLESTQIRSLKDGSNAIGDYIITSYFVNETDLLGREILEIKIANIKDEWKVILLETNK